MPEPTAIEAALRTAMPNALARLVRVTGSLEEAEDFVQDACTKAIRIWPEVGIPAAPAAWLYTVARNSLYDQWRHRRVVEDLRERGLLDQVDGSEPPDSTGEFANDDMIRLLFTCCHPDLPQPAQLVLTARAVAGLTRNELARALLIDPRAAEQRYTRAKRQVTTLGIPYEIPSSGEVPARLSSVLRVVYLLFNEGYRATAGEDLMRLELCHQAIVLGRTMVRLFPSEPEVLGLLALMVLQHARHKARTNDMGIVLLADQDRSLWDQDLGIEGCALVEKALRSHRVGPYQVQAAIAAVHFEAPDFFSTDWPQIAKLYEILQGLDSSPVVTINRAVAQLYAQGADVAKRTLDGISHDSKVARYPEYHAACAEVLIHIGRRNEAAASLAKARDLSTHELTRSFLSERIASLKLSTAGEK